MCEYYRVVLYIPLFIPLLFPSYVRPYVEREKRKTTRPRQQKGLYSRILRYDKAESNQDWLRVNVGHGRAAQSINYAILRKRRNVTTLPD